MFSVPSGRSALVEIGLTDLPKSGCAMAHPAHPGTTALLCNSFKKSLNRWVLHECDWRILLKRKSVYYLVQLIKHPILRIPNFNFPNLRCCKVFFFLFNIKIYWHIWVYFDINLKLLYGKNTEKVNKQKIRDS